MSVPVEVLALPVVTCCLMLSWAGLEKLRDAAPLVTAARELGIPGGFAAAAAVAIIGAELGTVIAVIAGVPGRISGALLALLGAVYAGAAAWSLLTGRTVSCGCFGATGQRLGWKQLAALPLWLLAAWAVIHMTEVSATARLATAVIAFLLLAIARAIPALRGGLAARRDRRAFLGGM